MSETTYARTYLALFVFGTLSKAVSWYTSGTFVKFIERYVTL